MEDVDKKEIIAQLKAHILRMEGFGGKKQVLSHPDLGPMNEAFPQGRFPLGVTHEIISPTAACAAAANGFVSGVLSGLMQEGGFALWVSTGRSLYPLGLRSFGLLPQQFIFVDVSTDTDALWVMESALKCSALSAVVAELQEISFAQSQRLQLAVEQSRITGFIHRRRPRRQHALACASRFRIRPRPSHNPQGLPGIGFPIFEVHLEKIKNGRPGKWLLEWDGQGFQSRQNLPNQLVFNPSATRYA